MANTISTAVTSGGTKNGVIVSGAVHPVYSKEILFQAQPQLKVFQFATVESDLRVQAGDTIKFTKYNDLAGSAKLSEVEKIQRTNISANLVSITVEEWGFAVEESNRLAVTAWDKTAARAAKLLGEHYGRVTEAMVQDEFRAAGSLQTILPNSRASRAALAAGDVMSVTVVKDAGEVLAVNKAPKIGGSYVGIIHPHVARALRSDSAWLDAHKYALPENILLGEIGMIDGVRFIDTTFLPVMKAATGLCYRDGVDSGLAAEAVVHATLDSYQSLFLGGNAVGFAEALPVEFRDGGLGDDFGRTRSLAWYAIQGAGQIESRNVVLAETL